MTQTQTDLAAALNVEPDQIKSYKQYGSTYTVITADYRKHTHVTRKVVTPAAPEAAEAITIPYDVQHIWANYPKESRTALRLLANALGIAGASSMTKAQLVATFGKLKETQLIQ